MSTEIECTYDAFISYSHTDKTWVRRTLLPHLERAGLTTFIDYRDFEPGAPSVTEMQRAVGSSRKTLLVLTPAYLQSAWTEFEALMLQTLDPANRARRLLPLLKAKCELPLNIGYLTCIDFTDPEEQDLAWSRLLKALGVSDGQSPPPPVVAEPAERDAPQPAVSPVERYDVHDLRRRFVHHCDMNDLRDRCFSLGVDADNYTARKNAFIREFLGDLQRQSRLDELVETLRREKPWVLE